MFKVNLSFESCQMVTAVLDPANGPRLCSLDHDDFSYVFQLDEETTVCAPQLLLLWPNLSFTCRSRRSSPRTL